MNKILALLFIVSVYGLIGCAPMHVHGKSRYMDELPLETALTPSADKANIIFIRPVGSAWRQASTVFDVTGDKMELIGVVPNMKKLVYSVDPGQYTFMVLGETTDYISADVEAGKSYYARVVQRMGAWKARFSLVPIQRSDFSNEKVQKWLTSTQYVKPNDKLDDWFAKHKESIVNKHQVNFKKWMSKEETKRPHLLKNDGVDG